jgi:hypothetical protein
VSNDRRSPHQASQNESRPGYLSGRLSPTLLTKPPTYQVLKSRVQFSNEMSTACPIGHPSETRQAGSSRRVSDVVQRFCPACGRLFLLVRRKPPRRNSFRPSNSKAVPQRWCRWPKIESQAMSPANRAKLGAYLMVGIVALMLFITGTRLPSTPMRVVTTGPLVVTLLFAASHAPPKTRALRGRVGTCRQLPSSPPHQTEMVTVPNIRRKSPTDSGQHRRLCLVRRKCLGVSDRFNVAAAFWLTYWTWCGGAPGPKTPRITSACVRNGVR